MFTPSHRHCASSASLTYQHVSWLLLQEYSKYILLLKVGCWITQ